MSYLTQVSVLWRLRSRSVTQSSLEHTFLQNVGNHLPNPTASHPILIFIAARMLNLTCRYYARTCWNSTR